MTYPPKSLRQQAAIERGTVQIKLTCVEVALMGLEQVFDHNPDVMRHLAKIRRWLMRCWESTGAPPQKLVDGVWVPDGKGKPLSAAIMRRADIETAAVDEARRSVIGTCATVESWSSWLVALDAIIHDVVCLWRPDGRRACWRYLGMTWETLARRFLSQCEDQDRAEEDGTAIYERIMEVVPWEV